MNTCRFCDDNISFSVGFKIFFLSYENIFFLKYFGDLGMDTYKDNGNE